MPKTTPTLLTLALLATLATTLALQSPTTLHIHAHDIPNTPAGATLHHDINITLDGPTDTTPGATTTVNLTLHAPPNAHCHLPNTTQLDPATGTATETLTCTPTHADHHPLHVTAESPPHEPATWNTTLPTTPDTLTGTLHTHPPQGYQIPLTLNLSTTHLDTAHANITLTGPLHDDPRSFHHAPQPTTLHHDWTNTTHQPALYGPGTYTLTANITGENIHPLNLTDTVTVPNPTTPQAHEPNGTAQLNVTVYQEPTLTFDNGNSAREDSVNRDDVTKNPGEAIITRLQTNNTDTVNITVHRTHDNTTLILEHDEHPVAPARTLEHTFAHDPLPAQRIHVTATAENATLTRTAQINDISTELTSKSPPPTIADGRPVTIQLTAYDRNHGSTPNDPGPIHGIPNLPYKIFQGNTHADGWSLLSGNIRQGNTGSLPTSEIPWPTGNNWATSQPGSATFNASLYPPEDVEPGSYRLSVYDPSGSPRLGGATFDLVPSPVKLQAPDPVPGETLPLTVNLTQPNPDTTARISITTQDQTLQAQWIQKNTTIMTEIPTLPPGDVIEVTATAEWPGRPTPQIPDATLELDVPAWPPNVEVYLDHNGEPAIAPMAILPGTTHEITPLVNALDPHGGAVSVDVQFLSPNGIATGWTSQESQADPFRITVPEDAEAGRYLVIVNAQTNHGETTQQHAVQLGEIVRLSLDGPEELRVPEGEEVNTTFTITNDGTATVERILLRLDVPEGINVQATKDGETVRDGERIPWVLDPGEESSFAVHVSSTGDARGDHQVNVLVAGVTP